MKVRADIVNALSEYFARDGVGFEYRLQSGEIVRGLPNYELQRIMRHELGLKHVHLLDVWDFRKEGFRVEDNATLTGTDGKRALGRLTRIIVVRR